MTGRLVLSELEKVVALELDAGRVYVSGDLRVVFDDLVARLPDVDGAAGELLEVDRAVVTLDRTAMLGGDVVPTLVELDGPRIRLAEIDAEGTLNAASWAGVTGGGGAGGVAPLVVIRNGELELGETSPGGYVAVAGVPVSGSFTPSADVAGPIGTFALTATLPSGASAVASTERVDLVGELSSAGLELRASGVRLDRWPAEKMPRSLRDIAAQLDLTGQILPTAVRVESDGSFQIELRLDGVSLSLPFDPSGRTLSGDARDPLRLEQVVGTLRLGSDGITGSIRGRADRVEYDVTLDYYGLGLADPFVCRLVARPFRLERDIRLLTFLPPAVDAELRDFGPPRGEVRAEIWLRRGAVPGWAREATAGAAPIEVPDKPEDSTAPDSALRGAEDEVRLSGELRFSGSGAAYVSFPYPVEAGVGLVRFTRRFVFIDEITGVGPRGGSMRATGWAGPFGATGELRLLVTGSEIPIDDLMVESLGDERGPLLAALTDRAALERLRESPGAPGGLVPDGFEIGGAGSLRIELHRQYGLESVWERLITVEVPELGVVASRLPIPILASGVRVAIGDDVAEISAERLDSVFGGTGAASAALSLDGSGRSAPETFSIGLTDLPVETAWLLAVLRAAEPDLDSIIPEWAPRVQLDGTLGVSARADEARGLMVDLDASGTARLRDWDDRGDITLRDASMGLELTDGRAIVEVAALADLADSAPTPVTLRADISRAAGDALLTGESPIGAAAEADGIDLAVPLERLLATPAPTVAERLTELRDRLRPAGRADLGVELRRDAAPADGAIPPLTIGASLSDWDRLEVDALGTRLRASTDRGALRYDGESGFIRLDGLGGTLATDGGVPARFGVDGVIDPSGDEPVVGPLTGTFGGVRFDDPAVRAAAALAGDGLLELLDRYRPLGTMSGRIEIDAPGARPTGTILPEVISLASTAGRVELGRATGEIAFDGRGGVVRELVTRRPGLTARVNGGWLARPDGGEGIDELFGTLEVRADRVDAALIGLAPDVVAEALNSIELEADGLVELRLDELRIEYANGREGVVDDVRVSGSIEAEGASFAVGVPVTEMATSVGLSVWTEQGAPNPENARFRLDFADAAGRASGVRFARGTARVVSDPGGLAVLLPELEADSHGGRLFVRGRVEPDERDPEASRFVADVRLTDVRLAPLLVDVEAGPGDATAPGGEADRSRGLVDASLTITGGAGEEAPRRGRGRVTVQGGEVVQLPLLTPLIQFSNLQLPTGDQLELAEIDLYIRDNEVVFERLGVLSDSIELLGFGTLALGDQSLDLRVVSRAVNRVPILSDVIESLRDELLTTTVRGTLADPKLGTAPFVQTTRLVDALLGRRPDPRRERLDEIEAQFRATRSRLRSEAATRAALEPASGSGETGEGSGR
ncbi:MAG: hypothetical protein AAFU70_00760 [Planctomycetota bacterium]